MCQGCLCVCFIWWYNVLSVNVRWERMKEKPDVSISPLYWKAPMGLLGLTSSSEGRITVSGTYNMITNELLRNFRLNQTYFEEETFCWGSAPPSILISIPGRNKTFLSYWGSIPELLHLPLHHSGKQRIVYNELEGLELNFINTFNYEYIYIYIYICYKRKYSYSLPWLIKSSMI